MKQTRATVRRLQRVWHRQARWHFISFDQFEAHCRRHGLPIEPALRRRWRGFRWSYRGRLMFALIAQIILVLVTLYWMTTKVFSPSGRSVSLGLTRLLQRVLDLLWLGPLHRFGCLGALWLWTVVISVAVTICTLWSWQSGQPLDWSFLLKWWGILLPIWWLLRVFTAWFFKPQPTPRRRPLP